MKESITTSANEDYDKFDGKYAASLKVPDAGIFWDPVPGECQLKIVLEVGFSQEYADLVRATKMWLEGAHVAMVILIKVQENPVYRNPARDLDDAAKANLFSQWEQARFDDFDARADGSLGPSLFRDLQWVGRIL